MGTLAYWLVVEFYDANGRNRLGSDGTWIIKDLKTVQGAKRRVRDGRPPQWAVEYRVSRVPGNKFYDETAWREVARAPLGPRHGDVRRSSRRSGNAEPPSDGLAVYYEAPVSRYRDVATDIAKVVAPFAPRASEPYVTRFDRGYRVRFKPFSRNDYREAEAALYRKFGRSVSVSLESGR